LFAWAFLLYSGYQMYHADDNHTESHLLIELQALLDVFVKAPDQHELEISVGRRSCDDYVSGVDFAYFKHVVESLTRTCGTPHSEYSLWRPFPIQHFMTTLFSNGVRTRTDEKSDIEKIYKKTLYCIEVSVRDSPFMLRFKVSTEAATDDQVDNVVHVRLQERWRYFYEAQWSYELTKVMSGSTYEEALASTPTFEFELEVQGDDTVSPEVLLNRGLDLIGRYNTDGSQRPQQIAQFSVLLKT